MSLFLWSRRESMRYCLSLKNTTIEEPRLSILGVRPECGLKRPIPRYHLLLSQCHGPMRIITLCLSWTQSWVPLRDLVREGQVKACTAELSWTWWLDMLLLKMQLESIKTLQIRRYWVFRLKGQQHMEETCCLSCVRSFIVLQSQYRELSSKEAKTSSKWTFWWILSPMWIELKKLQRTTWLSGPLHIETILTKSTKSHLNKSTRLPQDFLKENLH